MSVEMAPRPTPEPENTPKFPYEYLPYTHVHPAKAPRPHILFRAHDCWCEPIPIFVWGHRERPVAILLVHHDEHAPDYPQYAATFDKP